MREYSSFIGFVFVTTLLFGLGFTAGLLVGESAGIEATQNKAVKLGFGHYVADDTGSVRFEWMMPR